MYQIVSPDFIFPLSEIEKHLKECEETLRIDNAMEFINMENYVNPCNLIFHGDTENLAVSSVNNKLCESGFLLKKNTRFLEIPSHRHDYIEFNYVLKGTFTQIINGEPIVMKEGSLCILDKSAYHSCLALGEEDIVICGIFTEEVFRSLFMDAREKDSIATKFISELIFNNTLHIDYFIVNEKSPSICSAIEIIMLENTERALGWQSIVYSQILSIFTGIARAYYQQNNQSQDYGSVAFRIAKYIEKNYKDISLSSIGKTFNFHPNYVVNLLKRDIGLSYKEILIQTKMNIAAKLLANSELSIEDIMQEVHYSNISYFYRVFKSIHGKTPKEYRKEYKR